MIMINNRYGDVKNFLWSRNIDTKFHYSHFKQVKCPFLVSKLKNRACSCTFSNRDKVLTISV